MFYKIIWGFISIIYAPFFRKFSFPSHIGLPLFTKGLNRVSVSSRVRIYPGLRIETHGNGSIIFEKNISIGQNFHITSGGNLIIGSNTTIAGNVFVTNINHNYREINKHIMDQEMLVSETKIGENCFIGFGVAIQAGTILGKQCVIGSYSVVKGEFPDYSVIVGSPAKIIKRYNIDTQKWEKTRPNGSFFQ